MVHAHRGNQAEATVAEDDFVLQVQRRGGRGAVGEVAHREDVGQHRRRFDPGQREDPQAVALLPGARARHVQAVGEVMAHAAGVDALAEIELQPVRTLVEVELAPADVGEGRRGQRALLDRVLGGLAVWR